MTSLFLTNTRAYSKSESEDGDGEEGHDEGGNHRHSTAGALLVLEVSIEVGVVDTAWVVLAKTVELSGSLLSLNVAAILNTGNSDPQASVGTLAVVPLFVRDSGNIHVSSGGLSDVVELGVNIGSLTAVVCGSPGSVEAVNILVGTHAFVGGPCDVEVSTV